MVYESSGNRQASALACVSVPPQIKKEEEEEESSGNVISKCHHVIMPYFHVKTRHEESAEMVTVKTVVFGHIIKQLLTLMQSVPACNGASSSSFTRNLPCTAKYKIISLAHGRDID